MRLSVFIFSILLCCGFSVSANVLRGKISDNTGLPVQGAIVEITDLKTGAAADTGGVYQINNLPNGTYLVEVHQIGFATLNKMVVIKGDVREDFVLHESVIEKNEVVVTGTSLATEERKSLTPIQSMSIKDIHENASSNVIDAISNLPGFTALTTGPSVSKPVIRGLGYNRIITLNDGVRQEGQQWGDEHGIEIDDYNVTRIEVLKGPASLAYGSDAMAGVVNIISTPNIPDGKIKGNVTANYQTNAGLAALHADLGGNKNGLSWQVYGTQKDAHDYSNKYDGSVYDTRFHNTDFGATIGINKTWGSSRLSYTSFNEKTGIPEGTRDASTGGFLKDQNIGGIDSLVPVSKGDGKSYAMVAPYQHIKHTKIVWDNNIYLDNGGRIGIILGYQRNTRMEFGDVLQMNTPGLSLLLQTATYDVKYFLPVQKGWQMSIGLNGMSQWNYNEGDEFLIPDYRLFDGGLFAMAKRDINKWTFAGGLRFDMRIMGIYGKYENLLNKDVFNPSTEYFSSVSGSAGAGYNVNKNTIIKLNVASGYRAPNVAELSANGVHDGTFRYEKGNPGLNPEHSLQTDLGLSWSAQHIMVNVSVFDNYIFNYIYIRKADSAAAIQSVTNPNNYGTYIYTQGGANLYGGEIYVDYHQHPFDWLHLENTISYVRGNLAQAVDGNNNLPNMPPMRWLIELRAQRKTLGSFVKNAYAKAGIDMNSAQNHVFTAYQTETTTPGYTLLDAGIGGDITDRKHHTLCTLTLAGQNLTNTAYQNTLSRLRYAPENMLTGRTGIYNLGRNFSIICAIPLDFK